MLANNVQGTPTQFTAQFAGAFTEAEEADIATYPSPLVYVAPDMLAQWQAECDQAPEPEQTEPTAYGYSYYRVDK